MKQKNRMSTNSTITIKVISLLFGFAFWYLFMQQQTQYRQISVPLCFYDIPAYITLEAPELAEITVSGKRSDFTLLDSDTLAFHIDASILKKGNNTISLNAYQLSLPDQIKLLNCAPSSILVYVRDKQKQPHS